jgi:hypothetical protein
MKKTCIKFSIPKTEYQPSKDGFAKTAFINIFGGILSRIIPKANPDFDKEIEDVEFWLVECDKETGIVEREIGLDKENQVILKMPFNENYGFWIDNNLLLNDFKNHFEVSEISKESFEQNWNKL